MDAMSYRYPNALIQFEDFQTPHALPLLNKYRHDYRMFNDDIQGTGTVALAAMMGSMRASGKPFSALAEQTFVVAGAGSAGVGIVDTLVTAMVSLYGLSLEDARKNFWLVDHMGLLGKGRTDLTDDQLRYQRDDAEGGWRWQTCCQRQERLCCLAFLEQAGSSPSRYCSGWPITTRFH
jgi:malic enzyme